ncbi:MAG TPA: ABC transporter ATP-binding protein, partial [Chthonomonadaceae bacterium]|nr:ABC transporter ATP-binding protein [Chthonomonadaceae bacterium]
MIHRSFQQPSRPISRTTVRRVMSTFRPYRPQLELTFVAVLASASLGLMSPFFLQTIINQGLLAGSLSVVTRFTIYTLIVTIGATAFSLGYSYLSVVVGQHIMRDLRNDLYDHLQGMSLRFFTGTRTGEIQSRLANDVGGVQSVVSDTAANVLSNVTTVLSTLVAMIYMDWRLTLLSVGILPFFAVIASKVGGYARDVRHKVQAQLADINATMQETLSVSGILLTKTSGCQTRALQRFTEENEALTDTQIKQAMIMRYFFSLIMLTFSITPILVYWLAGYLIIHNADRHLTIGTIVAFTQLQSRLFFPLTNLLNVQVDVTSALALFDRIFEYLDMPQEIKDAPDAVALEPDEVRGAVAFDNVMFRYSPDQERPTLEDITCEAKPGELVALVGHSGAGKTTMTYLIPRLYDVNAGRVTIDGLDVRQIKMESLGRIIGVVTQETYLVHDTIEANLRYGRPDATEEEVIA